MRNINFFGSLSEFKDSIGMKQPRRGMQADANRKTAEAMPLVQQDLVDIQNFAGTLPPGQALAPHIAKRQAEGKKFVYENRLYQTKPKRVKKSN